VRVAVGEHADAGRSELLGELDVLGDLEDRRLAVGIVLERRAEERQGIVSRRSLSFWMVWLMRRGVNGAAVTACMLRPMPRISMPSN